MTSPTEHTGVALQAHGFATFIVSGGGTEFVRAVSQRLYGVPPDGVVGTLIENEYLTLDVHLPCAGPATSPEPCRRRCGGIARTDR